MPYEILKALHIVAVTARMAGLLPCRARSSINPDAEKGPRRTETFHNGVAWFLADVLPTSPVKRRDALARESTAGHLHTNSL
jgi:hypothetical protein